MIVQMKKVSIVVLDSLRKESVKALRKAGVLHLESMEGSGSVLASYKDAAATTDKALSIIEEIKLPKNQVVNQIQLDSKSALEVATKIVSLSDEKKSLYEAISRGTNELERLSKWGDVSLESLGELADNGMFMYLYEIPEDKYELIGDELKTIKVNSSNKIVRFLHLSDVEVLERPVTMPPEAYAVPLPEESTDKIKHDILEAKKNISRIESELTEDKKFTKALLDYNNSLVSDIEFETVYSGMGHEEKSDENDNSVKLAWVTGYVPVDLLDDFIKTCKGNEWAYTVSDPEEDDPVPTKLHNNKVVSLIYPLMDFLDVTPGYKEFDISGWFLLFFCIFFAMIFGDAGYGGLIALIGLLLLGKSKKGNKSVSVLVTLLGLCTMVWGVMTCSWFGIDTSHLPKWMIDISFAPVAAVKVGKDVADKNQQIFCFLLALVQLSIAHIKCLMANKKSLKWIGDFGALIQLWGTFYVVMSMVVDSATYPLVPNGKTIPAFGLQLPACTPIICIVVLAIGFILNFIFSNYEGSVVKSVLESLKNIISVLLGVVNVFSDIVSYIRLWAVALAGAAIASTVNEMAGPWLGKLAMIIAVVVLLVFGHGLNMILNVLSVVVHGVRLNTLEFSQHLGMTWSGTKYKPFQEKQDK